MYHSYHTNVNVLFLIFVQFQSIKVPLRCCFVVCSVQEEIQKKLTLTSHDELCSLSHFNHRMTQINHYSKHHLTLHLKEKFRDRDLGVYQTMQTESCFGQRFPKKVCGHQTVYSITSNKCPVLNTSGSCST